VRLRVPFVTAGVAGIVALSAALALPASAEEDGPKGSAFAVSLDATLLNAVKANITPQPRAAYPAGAEKSAIKVDLSEQLLRARALNATSTVEGGQLTSVGSIANVEALRNTLTATLIEARCVTTPDGGVKGESKLVDVNIGGTKVTVNGDGELKLLDGAVSVKVNEQIRQGDKLIVNALHVTVGKALKDIVQTDLILGSAACTAGKGGDGGTDTPTTSPTAPTSPEAPGGGNGDGSDDGGLANTGVSNVGLFIGAGVVLVAGGVGTLVFLRRRGAKASGPSES
jgi:LPXTG-motif cell wall-anchored protein